LRIGDSSRQRLAQVLAKYRLTVTSEFTARRAAAADTDLVTSIISLAFASDPVWGRALELPDGRTDHHPAFWRLSIEGALRYPWTWLAREGEATAVWIPPAGTEMTPEQESKLVHLAKEILGPASDTYLELLERFTAAQPKTEPHYYLTLLATHPNHRGRGIGMELLSHNLALIDGERMPAYLESTNPANDDRYARVGFEPIGQFSFPGSGPIVTTMWRPAR
jgi:GNAT superfamily N-acetyltransferase